MINKKYRLFLIFYIIVILYFLILTIKDHKNQDTIEHFNESMMKRKERRQQNSECKAKCDFKHENEEDKKVCKSYCKCKKRCNGKKKCIQNKCKGIKMNIYRNNKEKLKKIEIKDKIKNILKKEKKENKKERKMKLMEEEKKQEKGEVEKISFIDSIVEKYFTEEDKAKMIGQHNSMKSFYKDVKGVFRMKNK